MIPAMSSQVSCLAFLVIEHKTEKWDKKIGFQCADLPPIQNISTEAISERGELESRSRKLIIEESTSARTSKNKARTGRCLPDMPDITYCGRQV